MNKKYEKTDIPGETLTCNAKTLSDQVIRNVNKSSALWQQTGYLCDAIVVSEDAKTCRYIPTIPTDHLKTEFAACHNYFTVTLEFGQPIFDKAMNVFAIDRIHKNDVDQADKSAGLHPIVRYFSDHKMLAEHHLIEDFDNVWQEDVHEKPLNAFFDKVLAQIHNGTQCVKDEAITA